MRIQTYVRVEKTRSDRWLRLTPTEDAEIGPVQMDARAAANEGIAPGTEVPMVMVLGEDAKAA